MHSLALARRLAMLLVLAPWAGAQAQEVSRDFLRSARQAVYSAEADPARLAVLVEDGRKLVTACVACHGPFGRSSSPDIPSLAGQNAVYTLVQFRKFTVGTRPHELMRGVITAFTDAERLRIALFFGAQSPRNPDSGSADLKRFASGRRIFQDDFCRQCHGETGEGGDLVPRLGGQPRNYLERSLTAYRARSGERRDSMMSLVLGRLSDTDIKDLAEYLAGID